MHEHNRGRQEQLLLSKLPKDGKGKTAAAIAPTALQQYFIDEGLGDQHAVLALLADLVKCGWISEIAQKKSKKYAITAAGKSYLESLPPLGKLKPSPPPAIDGAALVSHQQAFLLLQPLAAGEHTLTLGVANKLPLSVKTHLSLNPTLATQMREKLAEEGFLQMDKVGRSVHLTITPTGMRRLIALPHHPYAIFPVPGAAINQLVDLAAGQSLPAAISATDHALAHLPRPDDMHQAIHSLLQELTRERHSSDKLVPIYEIRREISRKYGPDVARHDVLDQPMFELWNQNRVRLVSITDRRMAGEQELAESINNRHGTFFYMEDTDVR